MDIAITSIILGVFGLVIAVVLNKQTDAAIRAEDERAKELIVKMDERMEKGEKETQEIIKKMDERTERTEREHRETLQYIASLQLLHD
ncbi:hypothetical protein COS91_06085 [Candidatus Desantisbacteria bacterium CG07_land_8_20_14_0_80_39_15]|uniref:Uncharacterized protein n=1 Tax=Candidatus Desantisbacteria bacterium CG07_land_8_20_14_0_80_39_15 TaxID=1974549 RepID=A0A2M6ZFI7_9BACT|nr:MAG: hypothetical protein COS91_06085 [Candidatus Desantisbacteria bacterium CG07_land_8_20_14_0_80_39_15]